MTAALPQLARDAARWFETATRADGAPYVRMVDGQPDWITGLVHAAHDDCRILPDDVRYQFVVDALDAIGAQDDGADDPTADALDGLEPDTYTHDLTAWLHSSPRRVSYLDDARDYCGNAADAFQLLAAAQLCERREVFDVVASALQAQLDAQPVPSDQDPE